MSSNAATAAPAMPTCLHPDGSVDMYFGPAAPDGKESNWIQTLPGRHWFSYFRCYGPLEGYFDRSWKLGDITVADSQASQ